MQKKKEIRRTETKEGDLDRGKNSVGIRPLFLSRRETFQFESQQVNVFPGEHVKVRPCRPRFPAKRDHQHDVETFSKFHLVNVASICYACS